MTFPWVWLGRASRLEETHQIDEWCVHFRFRWLTASDAPPNSDACARIFDLSRGYTEGADGAEGYDASLRVDVGSAVLITRLVALK